MTPLPIDEFLPRVVEELTKHRNLVVVAEPGAGKTTRVPPAILTLLDAGEHRNLVMLQPRRVAARASAARIAQERNWRLGEKVGYHVRFDRVMTERTRLRVLTEGILTRQLLEDASLPGVGCVVLDEFHERSIHADLAVAMLREVQSTIRPDLRILVMSATLDAEPVAKFLGEAKILKIPGRLLRVDVTFRATPREREMEDVIADLLHDDAGIGNDGDVLVFLPGAGEIDRTAGRIATMARERDWMVLPLHGSLSLDDQTRALRPAAKRKVILATNIAETSLTIDGVTSVIDTGLHRIAGFDARRGMDTLTLARISRASAEQRAGRAGRTQAGRCVRLWSEKEHAEMAPFDLPEIARVDLAPTVLSLHAWGCSDPRLFAFFEPPRETMLASAERLLTMLGAFDASGKLSPMGHAMEAIPAHPRLARLLVEGAERGVTREAAGVAAILSEKDFLDRRRDSAKTKSESDVLDRMRILDERRSEADVDFAALQRTRRTRDALLSAAKPHRQRGRSAGGDDSVDQIVMKLVLAAYPDRVCRLRDATRRTGTMVGGGGVKIANESAVVDAELFVAVDARHDPRAPRAESLVRIASTVQREWLDELFPHLVRRETVAEFDAARGRVVGVSRTLFVDLVIDEQTNAAVDDETAARVLAEHLASKGDDLFPADSEAANLFARLDLLRRTMPEHNWPSFDASDRTAMLRDACRGCRSIADVSPGKMANAIEARLPYPLDRLLAQHAPESIEVPTGNRIRLRYTIGQPPTLAVRLQELFGLPATPRIAGGRIAVKLELLGPNYRPVQVTDDLASFWKNTYPQVRKDLRARYPKHSWPDDPLTAPPQAKGGRRRG